MADTLGQEENTHRMLKKASLLTRLTPARQDAPFRGQGRSSEADPRLTFLGSWERSENAAGGLFQHPVNAWEQTVKNLERRLKKGKHHD